MGEQFFAPGDEVVIQDKAFADSLLRDQAIEAL